MRAFLIHLAAFLAVNAVLAGINLTQTPAAGEPRTLWFVWPLFGWGIGVAAHGLALALARDGAGEGLLAERAVRGVAVHLFVYVAVHALLIAVTLLYTPDNLWVIWPLIGWGAGLALHGFLAYRAVQQRTVVRYATEQRLLAEIELERRAAEIAAEMPPEPPEPKRRRKVTRRKKAPPKTAKKPAGRRKSQTGKPKPS